jgi:hypothetical protein
MKGSVWERRIILVESEEEMMGSAGVRRDGRQASRQAGRQTVVSQSVRQSVGRSSQDGCRRRMDGTTGNGRQRASWEVKARQRQARHGWYG